MTNKKKALSQYQDKQSIAQAVSAAVLKDRIKGLVSKILDRRVKFRVLAQEIK